MNNDSFSYSRNSSILGMISVIFLLFAVIYGIYVLTNKENELNKLNKENKIIKKEYSDLKESTLEVTKYIENNPCMVEKGDSLLSLLPFKALIRPVVNMKPLNKTGYKNRELFRFTLHLDIPNNYKKEIKKVNYHFTHKYPFELNSRNPENNFSVHYDGWGCFTDVKITVFLKDKRTIVLHYNMCDGLHW